VTRESLLRWRWALVPALAALGVVVGLLVALLSSPERRAEASVLITSPRGTAAVRPLLPDVRALAGGSVLAGNVRSTLRIGGSDETFRRRLHATIRPGSHVVVLAASDSSGDRARQIAQEAAVLLTQLVKTRFGNGTTPLAATILDSAHVASSGSRHVWRDVLYGAVLGLLLAFAALAALGAREPASASVAGERRLRDREKTLDRRVAEVTRRELAVARRAGELAVRERDLEPAEAATSSMTTGSEPVSMPASVPEPPRPETLNGPVPALVDGVWNLNQLERLVAAHANAPSDRVEEWRTYLFFLRDHVGVDGALPRSFDALVRDVFGELVGG